jgi:hypothetical protein
VCSSSFDPPLIDNEPFDESLQLGADERWHLQSTMEVGFGPSLPRNSTKRSGETVPSTTLAIVISSNWNQ